MKFIDFAGKLHKDENGLTNAEMMMLAGVVIVPLIIVVSLFGQDIINTLGNETDEVIETREGIEWEPRT